MKIKDRARMGWWAVWTIALVALVVLLQPADARVIVYKVALITLGLWLGYWGDRTANRTRLHEFTDDSGAVKPGLELVYGLSRLARNLLIGLVVLSLCLGL